MILGTYSKQPGEKLDYDIDFSEWLPIGDTIQSNTVSVEIAPDNTLVVTTPGVISSTGKVVKVWVEAGTSGLTYQVNIVATTVGGRVKEVEFKVRVKEI
jgi:hypothetical protein